MLKRLINKIPFFLGSICVGFFYFPIVGQKFWMLDDHNFVYWYLENDGDTFKRFVHYLSETNLGEFPDGLRFTPTLSFLFAARTALLPNNPIFWFAINYLVVILTFISIYSAIKLFLIRSHSQRFHYQNVVATLISVFVLCNSVGAKVFSRLGTGEAYAILFFSLTMYFLQKVIVYPRAKQNWILLFIFQNLLIGCKENYIWISLFVSTVIVIASRKSEDIHNRFGIVFVLLSTAYFAFVVMGFLPSTLRSKSDIYGKGTTQYDILDSVQSLAHQRYFLTFVALSILIQILARKATNRSEISVTLMLSILFLVVDQVFYRGSINDHYLTNRVVAMGMLLTAGANVLLGRNSKVGLSFTFISLLLFGIITYFLPSGYARLTSHAEATKSFSRSLDYIQLRGSDISQLAFVAQSSWDYESIFSIAKHLKSRGNRIPLFLLISDSMNLNQDPNLGLFRDWMVKGLGDNLYLPIGNYDSKSKVLCIYSQRVEISLPDCDENVTISWLP